MKIREVTRLLKLPEAYYAGGLYRTASDIETVEYERFYELNISTKEINQEKEV